MVVDLFTNIYIPENISGCSQCPVAESCFKTFYHSQILVYLLFHLNARWKTRNGLVDQMDTDGSPDS